MNDKTKPLDFWKNAILKSSSSIQDAAQNLELFSIQIVLVVDAAGKLLGTVSDGDIRRGLLQEKKLKDSILDVVHVNPLVVPETLEREFVLKIMKTNKIHQIPIVDEFNQLTGIHLWDIVALPKNRSNIMVIMAGGMGTRMRPHTEACPKPMLLLGDKPMLEHIIERAKAEGFSKFIIAVNYLGHMVEDYFGSGDKFDIEIEYTREDSPLGTAGALSLIRSSPKEPFVVTNGDVITDIRYGKVLDFHNYQEAVGTMAVRLHEWQHPFGVVKMDGIKIIGFDEKPVSRSYINAGIYVLDPISLESLNNGLFCDMPTLFERLHAKNLPTVAYAMHEEWLDVGRPDDYKKAEKSMT